MSKSKGSNEKYSDKIIVTGFFATAANDRNAVKILFREKQYSLALFHLQQYIEKLAKVFAIEFEGVAPNNVRSHDFIDWLSKEAKGRDEEFSKQITKIEVWPKTIDVRSHCSQNVIEEVIKHYSSIGNKFFRERLKEMTSEQIETTSRYYATLTTILIVTRLHEQSTRYPAIDLDEWDYSNYTEDATIIQSLPFIFGLANHIENLLIDKSEYLEENEKKKLRVKVDLWDLLNRRDMIKWLSQRRTSGKNDLENVTIIPE